MLFTATRKMKIRGTWYLYNMGGRNTRRRVENKSKATLATLDALIMYLLQVSRLYHTLIGLQFIQVFYRLKYRFVKPKRVKSISNGLFAQLDLVAFPIKQTTLYLEEATWTFNFLNLKRSFSKDMQDWAFSDYGMLWTYNLNYFDCLLQPDMSKELGLEILNQFYVTPVEKNPIILHPYPTSLRIINTAKFISKWGVEEDWLNCELVSDLKFLSVRLEYHLLANHLLENAFALYIGGVITNQQQYTLKGKKLLIQELKEQILNDGMHYERSPMYHLIILERVLDTLNFAKSNNDNLESKLKFYAIRMIGLVLNWNDLDRVPMMQDSAYGVAPAVAAILDYSRRLLGNDFPGAASDLRGSGYRKMNSGNYKLFVNVGSLGPSYQPGHAHADELNFELFYKGYPVIVDTGISTYEKNQRRQLERSTESHNCIVVNSNNSSDVWFGFRVGRRAKVELIKDDEIIVAQHFGYAPIVVKRSWQSLNGAIVIDDELKSTPNKFEASGKLHFHPDISIERIDKNTFNLSNNLVVKIESTNETLDVLVSNYQYASGYNCLNSAKVITYTCKNQIRVTICEVSQ